MFGLPLHRGTTNNREPTKLCQDLLEEEKFILSLNETDIAKLLKMRRQDADEGITNYLDNKFRTLGLQK
jgi:hypothetical protein